MSKRYLVFSGTVYYPQGGWSDYDGSADTVSEAKDLVVKAYIKNEYSDVDFWWEIVDSEGAGTVVDHGRGTPSIEWRQRDMFDE